MASQWGKYLEVSIFGESHGKGIGLVLGNIPPGLPLDWEFINGEMARRAPGNSALTTPRKEADYVEILSGEFQGRCTGAPLTAFIANGNKQSEDYSILENLMRPGHSDYPAFIKYQGFNDIRGGGHFSGRLTAALVFGGAVAQIFLKERGISIFGRISSIKNLSDRPLQPVDYPRLSQLKSEAFPLLEPNLYPSMEETILKAKSRGDSVGGTVEIWMLGLPAGLGEPFFYSLESSLASLVFSVPSVKGLEFGLGFSLSGLYGSEANDNYAYSASGAIESQSVKQGGILGGLSVGGAASFRAAIKPTASITLPQATVNIKNKSNGTLHLKGRHDPCIVPRAVPVLEAVAALSLMDMILGAAHGH